MLLQLVGHPRIKLCFYSSMMRKTIVPIMHEFLHDAEGKLDRIKNLIGIFDREYCREMRTHKYYEPLKEENYDTYRDLHSIFQDPFCQQNGFTEMNTILIDSDSRKVQLWLENTIITEPYTREDVQKLPSISPRAELGPDGHTNEVRHSEWQKNYMQELTQLVLTTVEEGQADIPAYLRAHRPDKFKPEVLLPELDPSLLVDARANIHSALVEEQKE